METEAERTRGEKMTKLEEEVTKALVDYETDDEAPWKEWVPEARAAIATVFDWLEEKNRRAMRDGHVLLAEQFLTFFRKEAQGEE